MISLIKHLYHYCIAVFSLLWFGFPGNKITVIGVTGTDGKTTTTTLIYEILKNLGYRVSMITSVNAVVAGKIYDTGFHVTTPTAFWVQKYIREAVDHNDQFMVLEVTSHALSQFRVYGIPFTVAAITNVTHEHLDWHKTYDRYLETKLKLLLMAKTAVVNKDEITLYDRAMQALGPQHKLVTYGVNEHAMINPKTYRIKTKLPGKFNLYNCLAALGSAYALGLDSKKVLEVISHFAGVKGRMEVLQETPFTVIVDFAHTPNALEKVLATLRSMTKKRIIHVFGSAGLRDHSKRPFMGKASATYADITVLTEEDYRTENVETIMDEIQKGMPKTKKIYRYPKRIDAIRFALRLAKPGDIVIVTGKGHEKSLCRGTAEYTWSDQRAVAELLKK